MPHRFTLLVTILLTTASAFGQGAGVGPGGVYVDADRTLRARATQHGSHLKRLRIRPQAAAKQGPLTYVSIPRALEAARLGDTTSRHLGGITQLQYVFVFPDQNDLVIAGPGEAVDESDPARPLGKTSGRPVLRLDDLITALRTAGPGRRGGAYGCSIEMDQAAMARIAQAANDFGPIKRGARDRDALAEKLAEAAGPQTVRFFGVEPSTRLAFVCLEADYTLKRLTLGLDPSPVPQVPSHLSMIKTGEGIYRRWWFEAHYDPLVVGEGDLAFELRGPRLRLLAHDPSAPRAAEASAQQYADRFNEHLEAMARAVPALADLQNLTDLSVLAALIRVEKLDEQIDWDAGQAVADFKSPELTVPRVAETLVNHKRTAGARVGFALGGVMIRADRPLAADRRTPDTGGDLKRRAQRPESGWLKTAP